MPSTAVVVALEAEFSGADLYTGVGRIAAEEALTCFLRANPQVTRVINYGSAGSITGLTGIHEVTGYVTEVSAYVGTGQCICYTADEFTLEPPEKTSHLVDMEAWYLRNLCHIRGVHFDCWKYVSDHVGDNSMEIWEDNAHKGEGLMKAILRQIK